MELKQTFSRFRAVGRLKEHKLTIEQNKYDDGFEYNIVKGKVVLSANDGEHIFEVYTSDHFKEVKNDKHNRNSDYESIVALIDTPANTLLELEGSMNGFNDYKNKNNTVTSIDQLKIQKVRVLTGDAEEKIEGKIKGVVNKITPEIVNESETGRHKIEFVGVTYRGEAVPHLIYIDSEDFDTFESYYDVGDTGVIDINIVTKQYGGSGAASKGIGKRVNINNGFTRIEWIYLGADLPYDTDQVDKKGNPQCIPMEDIKSIMNERRVKLQAVLDGNDNVKSANSLKNMESSSDIPVEVCPF